MSETTVGQAREEQANGTALPIFDAHFHVVNPDFPLIGNDGYFPPTFTVEDYRARTETMVVRGGAVVSGSFQGFDQGYLEHSLAALGDGFVGVTQLPASTGDDEIVRLDAAGVRAIRFNFRRGGSEAVEQLDTLARRVHDLVGWHTELYVDAKELGDIADVVAALPRVSIDHLGLSTEGLPTLLTLVEAGVHVKATGFGRVHLDVPMALQSIISVNPDALMFGSDLPSTRARRPFDDNDISVIAEAVGPEHVAAVLHDNASRFYRVGG